MIAIEKTPLQKVLELPCLNNPGLGFGANQDPIICKYVFPALQLGINPILPYLPSGRYVVAGGIFRSIFFNEVPTDIDIYLLSPHFDSDDSFLPDLIDYTLKGISKQVGSFDRKKITIAASQTKIDIITIELTALPYSIQLITKSKNNVVPECADDIVSAFDIIPACFAVDITLNQGTNGAGLYSSLANYEINELCIHPDYFYSLANKYLITNKQKSRFEQSHMKAERFYKYISTYGFTIPTVEEMNNFNVLLAKVPNDLDIEYE